MTVRMRLPATAVALLALAGCETTNTGAAGLTPTPNNPAPTTPAPSGGSLPVSASGRMIAVRLPATITSDTNTFTNTPQMSATATGASTTDRTAAGGVGITGSVDADPTPNTNQGNAIAPAALVTAKADAPLAGGATVIGLDKAKGNIYFENGNFGDPQAESANAAVSSVSVYNTFNADGTTTQTILKDATTIRYRDGNAGDTEANYGVGYVGNPTAAMPGTGTATYKGFYEQGVGVYTKADGSVDGMFMQGDAELTADFGAGKVTGGVKNGTLKGNYDNATQSTPTLSTAIAGIAIDATIRGAEYKGTAALVDSAGATVGTVANGEAIGGFFGSDAAETAAAVSIEGTAPLAGTNSAYVLQGVIGGVKQ